MPRSNDDSDRRINQRVRELYCIAVTYLRVVQTDWKRVAPNGDLMRNEVGCWRFQVRKESISNRDIGSCNSPECGRSMIISPPDHWRWRLMGTEAFNRESDLAGMSSNAFFSPLLILWHFWGQRKTLRCLFQLWKLAYIIIVARVAEQFSYHRLERVGQNRWS